MQDVQPCQLLQGFDPLQQLCLEAAASGAADVIDSGLAGSRKVDGAERQIWKINT
jgi:hypothetical protein